jgi:hypothetical protein
VRACIIFSFPLSTGAIVHIGAPATAVSSAADPGQAEISNCPWRTASNVRLQFGLSRPFAITAPDMATTDETAYSAEEYGQAPAPSRPYWNLNEDDKRVLLITIVGGLRLGTPRPEISAPPRRTIWS